MSYERIEACSLVHDEQMGDEGKDNVSRALSDLETELSGLAQVDRETVQPGIVMVQVTPRNPDALPMTWSYLGDDEIVFQAGQHGGRWELAMTPDDIAFMLRLVRGIVEGRVRETFGPKRSRVQVGLEDGTTATETGYAGWLPAPGWKRRGRTVEYARYEG